MRIRRVLTVVVLLIVLVMTSRAVSRGQAGTGDPNVRLLAEAIARVQAQYVDELSTEEITENAIRGMLSALDPYSVYLDPDDYTNLRIGTTGNYEGLGIQISIRDGFLTVIAPFEGTPAFRAGIISGDRIVEIDGESTEAMTLDDAVDLMRGPRGTKVDLTVARGRDSRIMVFEVKRDVIELKSVPYSFKTDGGVGYVRLSSFSENTARDLRTAIEELQDDSVDGLILDLRGNPGGLLDQAVQVSECFLPSGNMVVETRGRHGRDDREYASRSRNTYELPLVVLVDQGSASASEIVAGALQDWDAGLVAGKQTFGKASVQTVLTLSDGSAIKLTTAKYYTPSGRLIQKDEQRQEAMVTADLDGDGKEPTPDDVDTYYTSMGRPITGGGGISPDIDLEPTEYPNLVYDFERASLFREYAAKFTEEHPDWDAQAALPDGELERFREFADSVEDELEMNDESFAEAEPFVERGVRREIARRLINDEAAYVIALEGDKQYQEALRLFREAPTLQQMFEVADNRQQMGSAQ